VTKTEEDTIVPIIAGAAVAVEAKSPVTVKAEVIASTAETTMIRAARGSSSTTDTPPAQSSCALTAVRKLTGACAKKKGEKDETIGEM